MTSSQATRYGKQAVFRALFRKNPSPTSETTLETFKDQQSNILPHNKLMIVFPTIAPSADDFIPRPNLRLNRGARNRGILKYGAIYLMDCD
jgi:hypothetical protein